MYNVTILTALNKLLQVQNEVTNQVPLKAPLKIPLLIIKISNLFYDMSKICIPIIPCKYVMGILMLFVIVCWAQLPISLAVRPI